ncbi:MAG: glycosyltransferase family 1 protein [Xanthomonadales bacterium]|nr:glycosyltransferase family 1 protein [Xanthomonadales bacterium]
MRLAIVTETFPPEINGVALTVRGLAAGAVELGHTVEVLRPRRDDPTGEGHGPWSDLVLPSLPLPRYPGLRLGLPARWRIQRHWAAQRPDAVYVATEGPLGWSAVSAARALNIAVASGYHTRFDHYVVHYGHGWLRGTAQAWLRRFHNRCDGTIVPTQRLQQDLQADGYRHVHRLPRGVDTERFHSRWRDPELRARWGAGPGDLVVLHVGRLAPEKNLALVQRSFAAIRQQRPQAKLVWVGDGPARAALQQGADGAVHFAGIQTGDDLARHYASADLFLFPSLTDTFGNVVLEALASGVPVVAFDDGAAAEHLRDAHAGRLAAFADETAFIDAAVALATDPEALAQASVTAHRRMQVHGLGGVASAYVELLQEIASQRAKPAPTLSAHKAEGGRA